MSYQKYRELMLGRKGAALPEGVTTKDFDYNDPQNSWYGTIYLFEGNPVEIAFYIWECSDENFAQGFKEQMIEFDDTWEMFDSTGGNGHYSAHLRKQQLEG